MSSLSSTSTSSKGSIPDPATDMPTIWIPLQADEAGSAEMENTAKGDMRRLVATVLFFVGGIALLLALIYLLIPGF